jgi:hypothetical protein
MPVFRHIDPHLKIKNEYEYIPIHPTRFRAYVHNPTRYDEAMFVFDTADRNPCHLLHFQASPICLMMQAHTHLASVVRLQSNKAEDADTQINKLLRLYRRQPKGVVSISIPVQFPASIVSMIEQPDSHPSAHLSTTITPTSLPSASAPFTSYGSDLRPEAPSSASTDGASEDTEVDPELYDGTDVLLLEYAKERAISWNDLKNRQPLYPGEEGGTYRFASAEQIIRGDYKWRQLLRS